MYGIKSHMATITIQDSKKYADRKQKATMNLWRNPLEENQKRLWDQIWEAGSNSNIFQ